MRFFIVPDKFAAEDGQKARQHDHVHLILLQQGKQGVLKRLLSAQLLGRQRPGGYPRLGCPFQSIDARLIRDHQNDLSVGQFSFPLRVQQGLKVGSAAGHQHCDAGQHRVTFSSPETISPTA